MEYLNNNSKGFILVQNSAACVLSKTLKYDHTEPILKNLHFLHVYDRIRYKSLLTWKRLNGMAPSYITELLSPYTPEHSLRSSDKSLSSVPRTKSSLGDRAFSVAAPKLWNSLPTDLRQATSLHHFKSGHKTFLFNSYLIMHIYVKLDWFYKYFSCIALL